MLSKVKFLLFSITARNFYWITTSSSLVALSTFVFTIVIARNFDPSVLGVFTTIASLILIFSDLGEFGTGDGLIRFLPPLIKNRDQKTLNSVLKTVFVFQLCVGLVIALTFIIFSSGLSRLFFHSDSEQVTLLIKVSSFGVISFLLFYLINSITVSFEKFRRTFILQTLYGFTKVILLGSFIILLPRVSENLILLSFIASPVVAFLVGSRFISFNFLKEQTFYPLKKILTFSLFLAANKIFVALFSRLDYLMLSALSSTYETGLYAVASRIAFIYPLVGSSLGTVIGPKYARMGLKESIDFSKKVFLLVFFLIISVFILIFLSGYIITIFGQKYSDSLPVLQLLLLANIPFLLTIPTNNFLTYTVKKPQIIAITSLVQLVVIFLANFLLIPKIGTLAPALTIGIAAFVSMMISFASSVYYLNKK